MRDAIGTSPCPAGSRGPPQSRPTSPRRRNAVPPPGDAPPASRPPLAEPAGRLPTSPRSDPASTRRPALVEEDRIQKGPPCSGVAFPSRTDAAECRTAKWRTGSGRRIAPTIATPRPASPAQDPRPSAHPCRARCAQRHRRAACSEASFSKAIASPAWARPINSRSSSGCAFTVSVIPVLATKGSPAKRQLSHFSYFTLFQTSSKSTIRWSVEYLDASRGQSHFC